MKLRVLSLVLIFALMLSLSSCVLKFSDDYYGTGDENLTDIPGIIGGESAGEGNNSNLPKPSGPVESSSDGYTFETHPSDVVCSVSDVVEASRAIDLAVADHLVGLVLDFSPMGEDYDPVNQFEQVCEFSSHISLSYSYSADKPQLIEVSINYEKSAASYTTYDPKRDERVQIASGNDIINRVNFPEDKRRGADFSDFPIDIGDYPTREVYNSEELWWAVEHGYRPVFAIENSSAENIYNRAKDILRHIISTDMNDFEKALAIYEYLIVGVTYDNDTYVDLNAVPSAQNACYYLEGVFNYGKAVCDGKSKAFVLLCGIEGIKSIREFGYDDIGDSGHAWNYVNIDDIWYCADTTGGDISKPEGNVIADFYGRGVELISYKLFLAPLSTNSDKYKISGLWDKITETDEGQSRVHEVLIGRKSDALIESVSEFATMIATVINAGYGEFSLTVSISDEIIEKGTEGMSPIHVDNYIKNLPHTLADEAVKELGLTGRLERKIFVESLDENKNYMYVFKLLPSAN